MSPTSTKLPADLGRDELENLLYAIETRGRADPRMLEMFRRYHGLRRNDHTLEGIAAEYGISRSRVWQLVTKATRYVLHERRRRWKEATDAKSLD